MVWRIKDIAAALEAEASGAVSMTVTGLAEPLSAGPDELALAMTPGWGEALARSAARAAIVWPGADWRAMGLDAAIEVPRARLAMARLTQTMDRAPAVSGIHETAVIGEGVELGEGVAIGPLAVIGNGARIGVGTIVMAHASIAEGAGIGPGGLVHCGARIGRNVRIGARAIIQPNAVIGGDGFSFVTEAESNVERARSALGDVEVTIPEDPTWHRIHSLGGVEIGDDVEIGANAAIDAGTIRATRIGTGTKIDNLVQVGHNVVVGQHCLLCGNVGIAGSTVLGDRVVLGGAVGVTDNLKIGDDVVVGAGSMVLSNVPAGRVMMGAPAVPMPVHLASYKALRRLPRLLGELRAAKKPVPKTGPVD